MENNLKPEDIKQEFCRVKIKEEQSFIEEIKEEIKEEKDCFDLTHVQSLEESVLVNQIKKEDLNSTDENNDKEFIKEEEEIDYVWPEEDIKETDPLALPEIKYELEVIKDLVLFQDIKPNLLTKLEDDLSNYNFQIETEVDIKDVSVVHDLVPKVKTESPSRAVKQEDSKGVQSSGITLHCNESFTSLNPLNKSSKMGKSRTRQVGYHRKRKMPADTNNSSPTYTGEKPYSCNVCSFKCSQSGHLKSHIRTHIGETPYSCKVCSFKCSQSGNLKIHMRTHTGETPYSCKVCSFKCSQSGGLKRHTLTHTGEKSYSCNVCSFKCSQSSHLKTHMLTHTGEKSYSCNVCSFKCSQSGGLKRHTLTHTGEKSYSCNVCSFKCSQSSNLKTHMLTHTGEKPYSCNVCSFKCSVPSNLKKHMLTHTGEKPYSCNVCSFKCSQSSNLKTHMLTHTGEKHYSCNVCSFKCSTSSVLKRHMRTHAGEKP